MSREEAGARALYVFDGYLPHEWDGDTRGIHDHYRERARVVLAAADRAARDLAIAAQRAGLFADMTPPEASS